MNFFERINPNRVPSGINPDDTVQIIRERILQMILLGAASLGLFALIASVISNSQRGNWGLSGLYILFYLALLYTTYKRDRNYTLRVNITLSIFYILGLTGLLESGLSGDGRVLLLAFAVMGTALLKNIPWGWVIFISVATLGIIGVLMSTQIIPPPPVSITDNSGRLIDWTTGSIIFALLSIITGLTTRSLSSGVEQSLYNQRKLNEALTVEKATLESRVAQRTEEIRRQALDLETAAELAAEIASSKDLESLLSLSVERIQSRFGFYHASIFLLDQKKEFAVLRAATGEAGKTLLENGHRLRVGEMGMVGYVVSKGEARISSDVTQDPFHFKNPALPNTRSELALPLRTGDEIIGALDVQSENPGMFTPDDIKIFQVIANQLAVAIDKARLVTRLQESLDLFEANFTQFTQKSWRTHLRSGKRVTAFRYRGNAVESGAPYSPEVVDAYRRKTPVHSIITDPAKSGEKTSLMAIPILLRGQVLGVLTVKFQREAIADDLVEFLRAVTERLSVALENVRLLEEIQVNAERDHLVAGISSRVRSATGIDHILRTAAEELGRTLGLSEVVVQLKPVDQNQIPEGTHE